MTDPKSPDSKRPVMNCNGITRGGQRCKARPLQGTSYCVAHTPEISDEQRKAWSAQGGANSSNEVRARKQLPGEVLSSEELASWLSVVFRKLIVGTIEPAVATAAANLARTMTEISRATDVQTRLEELQALIDQRRTA